MKRILSLAMVVLLCAGCQSPAPVYDPFLGRTTVQPPGTALPPPGQPYYGAPAGTITAPIVTPPPNAAAGDASTDWSGELLADASRAGRAFVELHAQCFASRSDAVAASRVARWHDSAGGDSRVVETQAHLRSTRRIRVSSSQCNASGRFADFGTIRSAETAGCGPNDRTCYRRDDSRASHPSDRGAGNALGTSRRIGGGKIDGACRVRLAGGQKRHSRR